VLNPQAITQETFRPLQEVGMGSWGTVPIRFISHILTHPEHTQLRRS